MPIAKQKTQIVEKCAAMWPRAVLDMRDGGKPLRSVQKALEHPGVYVLYRDDQPYYIGRAQDIFARVFHHANVPHARYFNLWNHFSAYIVQDTGHAAQVEGILISAMPTAVNSANPRITKVHIPRDARNQLMEIRHRLYEK